MVMKKHLYILVADSGRAKVFSAETPLTSLEPVFDQVNFQGRKKASEVYSDRPGSKQTSTGGYHSFAGERNTHEDEKFSRQLCKFLCDAHEGKKFDSLILIAPPHFLGELRAHLHKQCQEVLLNTIHKDLVKMPDRDIIDHVLMENPDLDLPKMGK